MFRNIYKINITDHASERVHQRLKLRGLSAERKAFAAHREGIDEENARGALATYIRNRNILASERYNNENAYVKIYDNCAWVFSSAAGNGCKYRTENREKVVNLLTVYPVPGEISKAYGKQKERNLKRVNYHRTTRDAMMVAGLV